MKGRATNVARANTKDSKLPLSRSTRPNSLHKTTRQYVFLNKTTDGINDGIKGGICSGVQAKKLLEAAGVISPKQPKNPESVHSE
jgi:hypothetical protein